MSTIKLKRGAEASLPSLALAELGYCTDTKNLWVGNGIGATLLSSQELFLGNNNSLHFHSSDRNRLNHTGTQLSSTISDFASAVGGIISSTSLAADTALKLSTPRIISLTGDATGNTLFDGSGDASILVKVEDDSHNHTIGNVDGLQPALDSKVNASLIGTANGVASLDSGGLIPSSQLPSYVDDVVEVTSLPATGETGKIYVVTTDGAIWRWSGSAFIEINTAVGSSETAVKLATAHKISLTGDVSGYTYFDGSADVSINAVVADNSHNHTNYLPLGGGVLTGTLYSSSLIDFSESVGSKILLYSNTYGIGIESGTLTNWAGTNHRWRIGGTDPASGTERMLLDSGGNLQIDGTLTVGGSSATIAGNTVLHTGYGTIPNSTSGNAATASKLATARTISITGDVDGSASFDGSGNITISTNANGDYFQSVGLSSSWGTINGVNTGAFNAVMGTASSATWLLSGTSGGVFRGGIQLLDSGGSMRLYNGSNYVSISGSTITASLSGNASTASKLATARTISLTGDVGGTVSFDGSSNVSMSTQVADDSHNHIISNVDGLQTALDARLSSSGTAVNSDKLDNHHGYEMSWGKHYTHTTFQDFNAFIGTNNFGAHFVQGAGNSPGHSGATQYYHQRMALGSEYGQYSLQLAIPRNVTDAYLYYRSEENGSVNSWNKIRAGYSDDSNLLDGQDGSYYLNASNLNAGTINDARLPSSISSDITGNAATATNASSLNGYTQSATATGNTIALRESDGDLVMRYAMTDYVNMSHGVTTRSSDTVFFSSTDAYIRKNNATGFRASLGVLSSSEIASNYLSSSLKGAANGLAELDSTGHIPSAQLPSYVDDVVEVSSLPGTGETGKIYILTTDGSIYRWTGSAFLEINTSVASADTAVKLATARTITLSGDLSGYVSFDGSSNVTLSAQVSDDSHNHIIGNVDGLQTALDGKSSTTHNHSTLYLGISAKAADSNLLDGLDSTSFVRSDISDTMSGVYTFNSSSEYPIQLTGSNDAKLLLDGTNPYIRFREGGVDKAYFQWGASGYLYLRNTEDGSGLRIKDTIDFSKDGTTFYNLLHTGYGTIPNSTSGNAATATKLSSARVIALSGGVSGQTSFDGSGNVTIATQVADDSHNHIIGNVDGLQAALDGKLGATANAVSASKLSLARTISLIGDVTGSTSFDGSGNVSLNATVENYSHSHSEYINNSLIGAVNGIATLDSGGLVPLNQLPSGIGGGGSTIQLQLCANAEEVTLESVQYFLVPSTMNGKVMSRAQATVIEPGETGSTLIQIRNLTVYPDNDALQAPITISGTNNIIGFIDANYNDIGTDDLMKVYVTGVETTPPKGLIVVIEYS
jgi:hypothetical protein